MTTRAIKSEVEDEPLITPNEPEEYGDIIDAETLSPALFNLCIENGIAEDQVDADVHVYLMTPDAKGMMVEAGIWKGAPEEFDLEALAKAYGSGTYRMKIYMRLLSGRKVKKMQRDLVWKLSPTDEMKLKQALTVPVVNPANEGGLVSSLVEAIKALQPPQQQMSAVEMMSMSLQMAQQLSGNQQQMNPIELMKFGMEMANQNKGGEATVKEPGSNVNDVIVAMIDKFGPLIPALLAQQQAMQQNAAPVQQLPMNPTTPLPQIHYPTQTEGFDPNTPASPLPDAELTNDAEEVDMNAIAMMQLKMGINFLLTQAKSGSPVETYAEVILDNVSPNDIDQIMAQPDPIAFLAGINEEVLQYRDWFTRLFNEVKSLLTDESDIDKPQ